MKSLNKTKAEIRTRKPSGFFMPNCFLWRMRSTEYPISAHSSFGTVSESATLIKSGNFLKKTKGA